MVSTRLLPRSEQPGGRPDDASAEVQHRIAASLRQHPSRSTACLTTLHEPWPPPGGEVPAGWCWAAQIIDALLALKAITDTGTLPDPGVLAAQRRLIVSAALIGASAEAGPLGAVGRRHRAPARRIPPRPEDY